MTKDEIIKNLLVRIEMLEDVVYGKAEDETISDEWFKPMDVIGFLLSDKKATESHIVKVDDGRIFLVRPMDAYRLFLFKRYPAKRYDLYKQRNEVLRKMSADGNGARTHRFNGKAQKAVLLNTSLGESLF